MDDLLVSRRAGLARPVDCQAGASAGGSASASASSSARASASASAGASALLTHLLTHIHDTTSHPHDRRALPPFV